MSMRVMKVKHNARTKLNKMNSTKLFALAFTDNQGGKGRTFRTSKGCRPNGGCDSVSYDINNACDEKGDVPRVPSHQQSYGLYLKRATMGIGYGGGGVVQPQGGLARRVVTTTGTSTFKKPQAGSSSSMSFSMNDYITNKRSEVVACDISSQLLLDTDCYNTTNQSGNCFKGTKHSTKDLLFLTQEQQLDRVKSLRTTCSNGSKVAEKPMMNSGGCVVIE